MAESYFPANSTIFFLGKPSTSEAGANKINRKIFLLRNTDNRTTIKNLTRVDYDQHGHNENVRDSQGVNRQAYNSHSLKGSDYDIYHADFVEGYDPYNFDCLGNYCPHDNDYEVIQTENNKERRLSKFGYNSYGFFMHLADNTVALAKTRQAINRTLLTASKSLVTVTYYKAKEQRQHSIKSKSKFNIPEDSTMLEFEKPGPMEVCTNEFNKKIFWIRNTDYPTTKKTVTSVDYDQGHNNMGEGLQELKSQSYKCHSVKRSSDDVEQHDAHSHDFLGYDLDCCTSNVLGTEHYEERQLDKIGCSSFGFSMDLRDSAAALEENNQAFNSTILFPRSLAPVAVDEAKEQRQRQSKPNIPEDSTICVLEKSCSNEAGTNEVLRKIFWIRNTDNPTSNNNVTRDDCEGRG